MFGKTNKSDKIENTYLSKEIRDDNSSLTLRDDSSDPNFPESSLDTRKFLVEYSACWKLKTTIRVLDSDNVTELYTMTGKSRKPQLTIHSNEANTDIATASFHWWKTRIEMNYRGQELTLESGGFLGVRYSYSSPTLNGEKLTWRPRKKLDDLNMMLVNGQGMAIARFIPKYMSLKHGGALEMMPECLNNPQLVEEVVVMALAVIHYKQTQRLMAANASAASSVSAASV